MLSIWWPDKNERIVRTVLVWMMDQNMSETELEMVNMSETELRMMNMSETELGMVNMSETALVMVNMSGTDLMTLLTEEKMVLRCGGSQRPDKADHKSTLALI